MCLSPSVCVCVFSLFVTVLMSVCFCHFVECKVQSDTMQHTNVQAGYVSSCWKKIKDFPLMLYILHSNSVLTRSKKRVILTIPFVCLHLAFFFSVSLHVSHTLFPPSFLPLYLFLCNTLFILLFQLPCFITFFCFLMAFFQCSISSIAHMLCHLDCKEEARIRHL